MSLRLGGGVLFGKGVWDERQHCILGSVHYLHWMHLYNQDYEKNDKQRSNMLKLEYGDLCSEPESLYGDL